MAKKLGDYQNRLPKYQLVIVTDSNEVITGNITSFEPLSEYKVYDNVEIMYHSLNSGTTRIDVIRKAE